MTQIFGRLSRAAALALAFALPHAQAGSTLDFESSDLTGLYLPGDSFVQGDYTLSTKFEFGIIDTAVSLGAQSPTGNTGQFYFNGNDGALGLARTDGTLFDLSGFSASFVPLDPPALQTTVLVATGLKGDGSVVSAFWTFAPSTTTHFPFTAYSGTGFAAFTGLTQVEFRACSLVGGVTCSVPTQNNGQFAIDDIQVAATVPEPATALLACLGLTALGLRARRAAR